MRYLNRFTVITLTLLGLIGITVVLNTDFSGSWDRVRDATPSLPADRVGTWWEPAWAWVQLNYVIVIGVILLLLIPHTRQLLVSTTIYVLPWVIGFLLIAMVITNENWHAVVYNGVDSIFDWIFSPLLPSNYEP